MVLLRNHKFFVSLKIKICFFMELLEKKDWIRLENDMSSRWELTPTTDTSDATYQHLFQLVKTQVVEWLESDMDKLVNSLYRLDIREKDVQKAFEATTTEAIADGLTTLILHREVEKYDSRKKYREERENQEKNQK